jgi:hypothetical protein
MNKRGLQLSQEVPSLPVSLTGENAGTANEFFRHLTWPPDTSIREQLIIDAVQDVRYDGMNTGLPVGASSDERIAAYHRIYHYQLKRELGLRPDASDAEVKRVFERELNDTVEETDSSSDEMIARRECNFLGLSRGAGEKELAAARKIPSVNQRNRLGLPHYASVEQVEGAIQRIRAEALRIYLGLPIDAPEEDVLKSAVEEKVLDDQTATAKKRVLLQLPPHGAKRFLKQALDATAEARFKRYRADNQEELMRARWTAAQRAQRHALGLPENASEIDIAMADSEGVYTSRRRKLGLPEDAREAVLQQASKEYVKENPLKISSQTF